MNNITPVASSAKTSADLVNGTKRKFDNNNDLSESLDDTGIAVMVVSRRSENLTKSISSHRSLMNLPDPDRNLIKVSLLFDQVMALVTLE
ncbi:hypothetical protein [Agarilytica rhodophyticola]|uniref:hypothetical protein n=1 Tax=Agarilytica rhodophyticola TaxID=1737490 RepID=UPI000B342C10|nr:hypothetical protein [Agarilytica rhodophyticola]